MDIQTEDSKNISLRIAWIVTNSLFFVAIVNKLIIKLRKIHIIVETWISWILFTSSKNKKKKEIRQISFENNYNYPRIIQRLIISNDNAKNRIIFLRVKKVGKEIHPDRIEIRKILLKEIEFPRKRKKKIIPLPLKIFFYIFLM